MRFASIEEKEYKSKIYAVGKYKNETSALSSFRFLDQTPLKS